MNEPTPNGIRTSIRRIAIAAFVVFSLSQIGNIKLTISGSFSDTETSKGNNFTAGTDWDDSDKIMSPESDASSPDLKTLPTLSVSPTTMPGEPALEETTLTDETTGETTPPESTPQETAPQDETTEPDVPAVIDEPQTTPEELDQPTEIPPPAPETPTDQPQSAGDTLPTEAN